jgi:hypothetical protein
MIESAEERPIKERTRDQRRDGFSKKEGVEEKEKRFYLPLLIQHSRNSTKP